MGHVSIFVIATGFKTPGDAYTHRFYQLIDGAERKVNVVDDTRGIKHRSA